MSGTTVSDGKRKFKSKKKEESSNEGKKKSKIQKQITLFSSVASKPTTEFTKCLRDYAVGENTDMCQQYFNSLCHKGGILKVINHILNLQYYLQSTEFKDSVPSLISDIKNLEVVTKTWLRTAQDHLWLLGTHLAVYREEDESEDTFLSVMTKRQSDYKTKPWDLTTWFDDECDTKTTVATHEDLYKTLVAEARKIITDERLLTEIEPSPVTLLSVTEKAPSERLKKYYDCHLKLDPGFDTSKSAELRKVLGLSSRPAASKAKAKTTPKKDTAKKTSRIQRPQRKIRAMTDVITVNASVTHVISEIVTLTSNKLKSISNNTKKLLWCTTIDMLLRLSYEECTAAPIQDLISHMQTYADHFDLVDGNLCFDKMAYRTINQSEEEATKAKAAKAVIIEVEGDQDKTEEEEEEEDAEPEGRVEGAGDEDSGDNDADNDDDDDTKDDDSGSDTYQDELTFTPTFVSKKRVTRTIYQKPKASKQEKEPRPENVNVVSEETPDTTPVVTEIMTGKDNETHVMTQTSQSSSSMTVESTKPSGKGLSTRGLAAATEPPKALETAPVMTQPATEIPDIDTKVPTEEPPTAPIDADTLFNRLTPEDKARMLEILTRTPK